MFSSGKSKTSCRWVNVEPLCWLVVAGSDVSQTQINLGLAIHLLLFVQDLNHALLDVVPLNFNRHLAQFQVFSVNELLNTFYFFSRNENQKLVLIKNQVSEWTLSKFIAKATVLLGFLNNVLVCFLCLGLIWFLFVTQIDLDEVGVVFFRLNWFLWGVNYWVFLFLFIFIDFFHSDRNLVVFKLGVWLWKGSASVVAVKFDFQALFPEVLPYSLRQFRQFGLLFCDFIGINDFAWERVRVVLIENDLDVMLSDLWLDLLDVQLQIGELFLKEHLQIK